MAEPIVVVGISRTPIGSLQGAFSSLTAVQLGASAIRNTIKNSGVNINDVNEVIMGCVLPGGLGQAPARQAALQAGLPADTPCTTVNKVCGSGMKAVMIAHDTLIAGNADIIIAGGMESMTNAPYLATQARSGYRFGHTQLLDHMLFDGLQDSYSGKSMGMFAELCAESYEFSRAEQDNYAMESLQRTLKAIESGCFTTEIDPVSVASQQGDLTINLDEQPNKANPEKIPKLKPAFKQDGTVTAANSSSISDGAAALVLTRESVARQKKLPILATLNGYSQHANQPEWFTTAPVSALRKLSEKNNWPIGSIDFFEINEAFAVVPMAAIKELGIDRDRVNVYGGACALGHPIGCSGARIVVTLINALRRENKHRGMACVCIGGGEATAVGVTVT